MNTRPAPHASPAPLRNWAIDVKVLRHVERELHSGRTLASVVDDPEVRDTDPYVLVAGLGREQPLDEIEDPLGDLSDDEGHHFSLLGRHRRARVLSTYIISELRRGRALDEVLADELVRTRIAAQPYLLEDLASDQLVKEAVLASTTTKGTVTT
jgi:hypothetical protein